MKKMRSKMPTDKRLTDLNTKQRETLDLIDADLDSIEKSDAEGTFRVGDNFIAARATLPSGAFKEWYRERRKYSGSYVYDLIRVSEKLAPYRERFIKARAQRSSLIELGSKPEAAETVLNFIEGGRRLTVSEVRSLLTDRARSPVHDEEAGGEKGMLEQIEAKKEHVRDLVERLQNIIHTMEEALDAPRVGKEALYDMVYMDARWARLELYNLCAFVQPAEWDRHKPTPVEFEEGTGWARLARLLYLLGGKDTWPSARDLRRWLEDDAIPLLRWGANGEPLPGTGRQLGASELTATDEQEQVLATDASQTTPVEPARENVLIWRSESRVGGVYEVRTGDDAAWCPASLTPEGWDCLDGREFPPLDAKISIRVDAGILDKCARFVASVRREGVHESRAYGEIEKVCRQTAHVLGTMLNGLQITDGEKSASVLAQHRTATAIYNNSHSVLPLEYVETPDVIQVAEPARKGDPINVSTVSNANPLAAQIASWIAAISAGPEPETA